MSRLEDQLALQIRAAGLPEPEREAQVVSGRRFRSDFAWRRHKLVCEVEGGIFRRRRTGQQDPGHTSAKQLLRDMEKASLYAVEGYRLVRVAAPHIREGKAIGWLEAILLQGSSMEGGHDRGSHEDAQGESRQRGPVGR